MAGGSKLIVCDAFIIREGVKDFDGNGRKKHEWPRRSGAIGKNRSVRHSVQLSIGQRNAGVKLLEEISLPSLLVPRLAELLLYHWENGAAGFEPASLLLVLEYSLDVTRAVKDANDFDATRKRHVEHYVAPDGETSNVWRQALADVDRGQAGGTEPGTCCL